MTIIKPLGLNHWFPKALTLADHGGYSDWDCSYYARPWKCNYSIFDRRDNDSCQRDWLSMVFYDAGEPLLVFPAWFLASIC